MRSQRQIILSFQTFKLFLVSLGNRRRLFHQKVYRLCLLRGQAINFHKENKLTLHDIWPPFLLNFTHTQGKTKCRKCWLTTKIQTKGQLISKCLFGVLKSSKKRKQFDLRYHGSKVDFFWKNLKHQKDILKLTDFYRLGWAILSECMQLDSVDIHKCKFIVRFFPSLPVT